ncbi:hypothetical protein KKD52_14690 [Myxococcota bacterium]|nr:hypothetical protein [Myxococcota bacterium]
MTGRAMADSSNFMRRFLFLLPFILACELLLVNCNSHATFDHATCGNNYLDNGEFCDNTPDGILTANGKTSCFDLGMGDGTLKCTETCVLDTSNCEGGQSCDPLDPFSCGGEDISCYFDGSTGVYSCDSTGDQQEGATCSQPSDCVPGMTCYNEVCRLLCQNQQACEGNPCDELGWPDGWGICPQGTGDCDPVYGTGCSNGEGCYFKDQYGHFECQSAGDMIELTPCGGFNDCEPGLLCVVTVEQDQPSCTRMCRTNYDCQDGTCELKSENLGWGLCLSELFGTGCDPMNSDCPGSLACVYMTEIDTTCLVRGNGEVGQDCSVFFPCAAGLHCEFNNDMQCHRLCNSTTDCGGAPCNPDSNAPEGYSYCQE